MATPIIRSNGSVHGVITGSDRNDLGIGEVVTLTDTEAANSGGTYAWTFEDRPVGSAAVITNSTTATASFEPDVTGTYRIRCTVNGTSYDVAFLAVPLPVTGGRIPAYLEDDVGGYNEGGNTKGWHPAMTVFMRAVDSALSSTTFPGYGVSGNMSTMDIGDSAASGGLSTVARSDHQHPFAVPTVITDIHGTASSLGASSKVAREDHVHFHGAQTVPTLHALATTSAHGFMSSSDKSATIVTVVAEASLPNSRRLAAGTNITFSTAVAGVLTINSTGGGGGSGADADGSYIVQTATNAPANAQVLGALGTGLLKNTTTTGVLSIGVANTDYAHPSSTYIVQTATDAPAGAQVMGALATGLVKNTTTTGVQSIAVAGTDYENPLTFSGGVTRSTNAISITTNGITNSMIRQGAARSVLGVTGNATANVADIAGGGASTFLSDSGTALAFTSIGTGDLPAPGGQLGGTYASATVLGIRETAGPTLLTFGAIADGEFLKRVGTTVVSAVATAGANALGTYLVQTATNAPANAQIMASLATGIVKNTTTTGVQSIAVAGTDYENPLTFSGGVTRSTNAISITTNGITNAMIRQGVARSVIGVTGNATANVADIAGGGASTFLRDSGTALAFSSIATGDLPAPGGQLGGTYASATVLGIRETGGPTLLTFGAIVDGEFLKRVGTTVVSAAAGGSGYATIENPNGTPVTARSIVSFSTSFTATDNVDTTDITLATNGVSFSKIAQGSARSVLGVTGNATADLASIQGTADQVLRVNGAGTALAFGTIATAGITDAAVTLAKQADLAGLSVPGRASNTSGVMAAITAGTDGHVLRLSGTTLGFGTLAAGAFAASTIAGTVLTGFTDTTLPIANSSGQLVSSTLTLASNYLDHAVSSSGATVKRSVRNTSNTATSKAWDLIEVAGATADDPYSQYSVSGVTNFVVGIDNSDSDYFKIHSGTALDTTTAGIRMNTAGNVSFGVTAPSASTGAIINIRENNGNPSTVTTGNIGSGGSTYSVYSVNSSANFSCFSASNSFLGTGTTQTTQLNHSAGTGGLKIGTSISADVALGANNVERLRILSAGTVKASLGQTVASGTSAIWDGIDVAAATLTLSGSTNITTATGVNLLDVKASTITSGSAITVTNAAALRIAAAPVGAGSTTITNAYSLWVDAGLPRIDSTTANATTATVLGSVGPAGANTTVQEWLTIDINGTTRYLPCF